MLMYDLVLSVHISMVAGVCWKPGPVGLRVWIPDLDPGADRVRQPGQYQGHPRPELRQDWNCAAGNANGFIFGFWPILLLK